MPQLILNRVGGVLFACIVCFYFPAYNRAANKPHLHSDFTTLQKEDFYNSVTQLLQKYVVDGNVNYKLLEKDKQSLNGLVKQIAVYDLKAATASEKKAFYLNAYNLLVIKQVVDRLPIKSVMEINGFFDKQKFNVAGENLTLNEVENNKLREPYKDARIHFALVCGAKSCPPLLAQAYHPGKVEDQLDKQTRIALQNSGFIRVSTKQKYIRVSEIFKWYEADFLAAAPTVISFINRYRKRKLPDTYSLGYYKYDWALNEVGP